MEEVNQRISVLKESKDYLVINKPWGVVTNRAESVSGETVQDWAMKKLNLATSKGDLFHRRSGIAHRLDKETSGCLIIAKTPEFLEKILSQFQNREVTKEYLAVVHGRLEPREGRVKLPLSRARFDKERFAIHYAGKPAETAWQVEKYGFVNNQPVTVVHLFPKTGRTHQIRVHLSHLGYPLFADEKYLTKDRREGDRLIMEHHFLHAQKITFRDNEGDLVTVEAPLPEDAKNLLSLI